MGCLQVQAFRIGESMLLTANKEYPELLVEGLRKSEPISVISYKIGKSLSVECSIICSINKSAFLFVSPDVVWLTSDMLSSTTFDITSNTYWDIN